MSHTLPDQPCTLSLHAVSPVSTQQTEEKERVEKFEGEEDMLARYTLHTAVLEKDKELGWGRSFGLTRPPVVQGQPMGVHVCVVRQQKMDLS